MAAVDAHSNVPRHVGIIPDGNRRWATDRGLPTLEGHRRGTDTMNTIASACFDRGVEYLTVYAFSTENWQRATGEVSYLMDLFLQFATGKIGRLMEEGVRLRILGDRTGLSDKLNRALDTAETKSRDNTRGTFSILLNYGGQQEIVQAVKQVVREGLSEDQITPEAISGRLYAPDIPPLDLIIRTSGEQRISNFMLWRAAYSEMFFEDGKHWPEYDTSDLDRALADYASRDRRFGGSSKPTS
jgi:undecaprenyl diphosphate synthase